MSVLAIERARVEPPAVLPVDYLSLNSLTTFQKCPESWRRRYLEHDPEPSSGKMVLGSAAGAALAQHFGRQLESGTGIGTEELLDEFSAEWEDRRNREEVDYESETPGALKDSGAGALRIYHSQFTPAITPVSVEREFELSWSGVEWKLIGYLDLEDDEDLVRDYKMRAKKLSERDAAADLQPDIYLAARRAEGNPAAGFRFDTMVRTKQPYAEIVPAERSEQALDRLTDRIFAIAAEIAWRCERDTWIGASPYTWFCGSCRYAQCPWRLGS